MRFSYLIFGQMDTRGILDQLQSTPMMSYFSLIGGKGTKRNACDNPLNVKKKAKVIQCFFYQQQNLYLPDCAYYCYSYKNNNNIDNDNINNNNNNKLDFDQSQSS